MHDLDFETFSSVCKKYSNLKCPFQLGKGICTCYNNNKVKDCYELFLEKRKWNGIKSRVLQRDNYKCRLYSILNDEERKLVPEKRLLGRLDPAHIFGRGTHPKMKLEIDNIVTLHRFFHDRMDTYKNPITGVYIEEGEKEQWWIRILGESNFLKLKEKAFNK